MKTRKPRAAFYICHMTTDPIWLQVRQREDLAAWAMRHDFLVETPPTIFTDRLGEDRQRDERPDRVAMLYAAAEPKRQFDVVVAVSRSRVARTLREFVTTRAQLRAVGVKLLLLDERGEDGSPESRATDLAWALAESLEHLPKPDPSSRPRSGGQRSQRRIEIDR
jgi:DNA invertase Pin-like site-specific DNA recombinase